MDPNEWRKRNLDIKATIALANVRGMQRQLDAGSAVVTWFDGADEILRGMGYATRRDRGTVYIKHPDDVSLWDRLFRGWRVGR